MIFLTATPIYDSHKELPELVYLLNPSYENIKNNLTNLNYNYNLEKLRGKISYFSGSSKNAYPKSNLITHEIIMSNIQDNMTYEAINAGDFKNTANDYEGEAFLANHPKEDLATDVEVQVPDLPMFSKTKKLILVSFD